MKKNKTIILGSSGSGKSYKALEDALKNNGTTLIVNASTDKGKYEKDFPTIVNFESKDCDRSFHVEENNCYYLCQTDMKRTDAMDFTNSLILGCGYGDLGQEKTAMVVYDDGAWERSNNNAITLWQLSHMKCNIIITSDALCDVLKIDSTAITQDMINDILKYWNIIEMHREIPVGKSISTQYKLK